MKSLNIIHQDKAVIDAILQYETILRLRRKIRNAEKTFNYPDTESLPWPFPFNTITNDLKKEEDKLRNSVSILENEYGVINFNIFFDEAMRQVKVDFLKKDYEIFGNDQMLDRLGCYYCKHWWSDSDLEDELYTKNWCHKFKQMPPLFIDKCEQFEQSPLAPEDFRS